MSTTRRLLLTLVSLTALSIPILAGGPDRPVLQAAQKATPISRWQAADYVRQAYPQLVTDLHAQLKASYPELEHAVVDAALDSWEKHPDLAKDIIGELLDEYGPELVAARQDVAAALEQAYPNFKTRLKLVLDQRGLASTWQSFVNDYDPGLLPEVRRTLPVPNRDWRPGALRDRLLDGWGLASLGAAAQGQGPKIARDVVAVVRRRAPGLAADFTVRWLDGRQELANALRAEFPGAGRVVAQTLQAKHPQLVSQILAVVEQKSRPARADFRQSLEASLPGFGAETERLLATRYPHLRQELIAILKG